MNYIFDMDGVIVDTEPLHAQHLKIFLKKLGINADNYKKDFKGVNANETWTMIMNDFGLDFELDEITAKYKSDYIRFLEGLEKIPPIPGVVELIKFLNKNHTLALASSAYSKRIELILSKLDLEQYFSDIVSGDEVEKSKPNPEIFLLAAKKIGAKPSECTVIEDAANGVAAAKAAGMRCVGYSGSLHNEDDLSKADVVTDDFNDFLGTLI